MVILGQMKKWYIVENLEVRNCTSINEFVAQLNLSANSRLAYSSQRGGAKQGSWGIEQVVYAYVSWIVVAALQRTIFWNNIARCFSNCFLLVKLLVKIQSEITYSSLVLRMNVKIYQT